MTAKVCQAQSLFSGRVQRQMGKYEEQQGKDYIVSP